LLWRIPMIYEKEREYHKKKKKEYAKGLIFQHILSSISKHIFLSACQSIKSVYIPVLYFQNNKYELEFHFYINCSLKGNTPFFGFFFFSPNCRYKHFCCCLISKVHFSTSLFVFYIGHSPCFKHTNMLASMSTAFLTVYFNNNNNDKKDVSFVSTTDLFIHIYFIFQLAQVK
jgi:hypothetical protein